MKTTLLRYRWTMRIWQLVLFAVLLLGTSCAPSGTVIKVEPPASAVQVNETVKVLIQVEKSANLTASEVHLSFDATTLEVIEIKDGGLIQADFVVQKIFDNTAGTVDYAVAQINRAPANGNGTLFEIVFRAKTSGQAQIRFRGTPAAPTGVILSDSDGKALQARLIDGAVNVK